MPTPLDILPPDLDVPACSAPGEGDSSRGTKFHFSLNVSDRCDHADTVVGRRSQAELVPPCKNWLGQASGASSLSRRSSG